MFFKFMKNNPVKKINYIIKKAFQKNRSYYRPTEILPFFGLRIEIAHRYHTSGIC